jgi:hypothetical protein
MSFACVQVREEGYVAVAVPPTFDVDVHHAEVAGLEPLIDASKEMTPARKAWLLERLQGVRSEFGEGIPVYGGRRPLDIQTVKADPRRNR